MEKTKASAVALGMASAVLAAAGLVAAVLAAAGLVLGGVHPAAGRVVTMAAVATRVPSAVASPEVAANAATPGTGPVAATARLDRAPAALDHPPAGTSAGFGAPGAGSSSPHLATAAGPTGRAPAYGNVSLHTRAGRRYMSVVSDPTAGIGPLPPGWTATSHTIVVGGLTRVYITVAPADLTGSVPVVVLMHGVLMTAAQILDVTQLAVQTGPAIIVAPQGWEQSWNAGGCCGPAYQAGINDVAFIQGAVGQVLAANPAANRNRVYAVGFSNGGRMAYRLACDLPGMFAGFAAAEAVPVQSCSTLHPLSILIIAQQADPLLTVDAGRPAKWIEGAPEPTVAATVAREAALDGCAGPPALTYTGVAERSIWNCAAGTRLTYVWYPGGSHSWRRPVGATPGASDMVLSLMGGQLVAGRSIHASSSNSPTSAAVAAGTATRSAAPAVTTSDVPPPTEAPATTTEPPVPTTIAVERTVTVPTTVAAPVTSTSTSTGR